MPLKSLGLLLCGSSISLAVASSIDWVNVDYAMGRVQAAAYAATPDAQEAIHREANFRSRATPQTIVNSNGILPPSQDIHDYLSWAPYHWPNCNWCANDKNRLKQFIDTTNITGLDQPGGANSEECGQDGENQILPVNLSNFVPRVYQLSAQPFRSSLHSFATGSPNSSSDIFSSYTQLPSPTAFTEVIDLSVALPSLTALPFNVQGSARAAAKTTCTPSPTKPLASSATWTACPYAVHDGQVNPDTRNIPGPDADMLSSQAIYINAISYAIKPDLLRACTAVKLIDAFFLNSKTRMKPNMDFGQLVRGPGPNGRTGTFMGVLDMRGFVKTVNAITILRAKNPSCWATTQDQAMNKWGMEYLGWLTASNIARKTATRPNNHGTFFAAQLAAAKILVQDLDGARTVLRDFFATRFIDQIAASGEQPFEAVRTRPFHYRSFNLEALITLAKLGDALGLNFWTTKSKYGATIQDAVDHAMRMDAKNEDVKQLAPHVAAIAAAYGDPKGRYEAYLKRVQPNYQSQPYWFFNQKFAFQKSPAIQKSRKRVVFARDDTKNTVDNMTSGVPGFICPEIFYTEPQVELEVGLFVTCEQLRPFYEDYVQVPIQSMLS